MKAASPITLNYQIGKRFGSKRLHAIAKHWMWSFCLNVMTPHQTPFSFTFNRNSNFFVTFKSIDCERYTLYVGRFISHNSELFKDPHANKALRMQMIEKKIDDLYIDMSTADICEFNLQRSACDEIENLVK